MKITVDVDCTPEEARAFFGLPDVRPMQDVLMKKVEERMITNLDAVSPEALLKTWLPAGVQGIEQLQKMFWAGLQASKPQARSDK
ncbi:MAG: hypothetical protein F8N37_18440 [Telmatospirillum sp.]|nr:hypothetical protein [Telmatospirillum sp.]